MICILLVPLPHRLGYFQKLKGYKNWSHAILVLGF